MDEKLSVNKFDKAIRVEIPWIDAEKVRLGVDPAKSTNLVTLLGTDSTAGSWKYLYAIYLDKTLRTELIITSLETLRTTIYEALLSAYRDIPINVWTDQDRIKLGRKTGTRAPRTTPGEITDQCIAAITQFGGAKMKVSCKSSTDQTRPSKAANSDGVTIYYEIVVIPRTEDNNPELNGIARLQAYMNALKCTNRKFFSSASFMLELGGENAGLSLLYHIQWTNSKHPENDGPLSGPHIITIL